MSKHTTERSFNGFEVPACTMGYACVFQWERKANLSRFEGSSSISSADFFGDGSSSNARHSGLTSSISAPDLDDVKESVRQGVTKVAGKISSLANGVLSSIQVRVGTSGATELLDYVLT